MPLVTQLDHFKIAVLLNCGDVTTAQSDVIDSYDSSIINGLENWRCPLHPFSCARSLNVEEFFRPAFLSKASQWQWHWQWPWSRRGGGSLQGLLLSRDGRRPTASGRSLWTSLTFPPLLRNGHFVAQGIPPRDSNRTTGEYGHLLHVVSADILQHGGRWFFFPRLNWERARQCGLLPCFRRNRPCFPAIT